MPHPAFLSDSTRWTAVQRKDALADGVFLYAVRTTKIYCRPVCKARLARRANVDFYDTAEQAERAGYRPCKRCKPESAGRMPENHAVRRVRAMVERQWLSPRAVTDDARGQQPLRPPPVDSGCLEEMARQAGVSKWHFHRIFKTVTDMTPAQYLRHSGGGAPSSYERNMEEPCSVARGTDATMEALGLECWAIESTQSELTADLSTLDDADFDFDSFITSLDEA
ncbi:metal binding domain of Ada-domain-containing protein [Apiospora marii]|uniref:Metal binding domain of Ada-domain-containing protein n=1 Tax=Apiospora marii TaxID=335849 RepID=A0ABR1SIT7_9PEZI